VSEGEFRVCRSDGDVFVTLKCWTRGSPAYSGLSATRAIIERGLPLCRAHCASILAARGEPFDDLVQAARGRLAQGRQPLRTSTTWQYFLSFAAADGMMGRRFAATSVTTGGDQSAPVASNELQPQMISARAELSQNRLGRAPNATRKSPDHLGIDRELVVDATIGAAITGNQVN